MENPPLWIWGVIVGAIIASKFIYRWQATKYFAKEDEERRRKIKKSDHKITNKHLRNNDIYDNVNNSNAKNITSHKYSLRRYYKDYFAIKKKE